VVASSEMYVPFGWSFWVWAACRVKLVSLDLAFLFLSSSPICSCDGYQPSMADLR
jgi:hypothetical protein